MLLSEARRDPNDSDRLKAGCIGQQLAEMPMIGPLKLIFDQYPMVGTDVLTQDIGTERTNRFFLRFQFEVNSERLAQNRDVLRPRKPWRKTGSLAGPDVAKVYTFQAS